MTSQKGNVTSMTEAQTFLFINRLTPNSFVDVATKLEAKLSCRSEVFKFSDDSNPLD